MKCPVFLTGASGSEDGALQKKIAGPEQHTVVTAAFIAAAGSGIHGFNGRFELDTQWGYLRDGINFVIRCAGCTHQLSPYGENC